MNEPISHVCKLHFFKQLFYLFLRYQLYLQVRKDISTGSLSAPIPILAKLAGLCLQSESIFFAYTSTKDGVSLN